MGISQSRLGLSKTLLISAGAHALPFVLALVLTQVRFFSMGAQGNRSG